ncbi:unnamed protein product [Rotaria sp. Silwood2]|nr:unnamed protein product [Rotaria sp. Silwood2]CAF3082039.1 unnamed protein product [Rotaria sp. Silwood2]CAF3329801.1 unnamed protein product [Rotaria sp. Silwood2]CAF3377336.1 unnamed protein product [Rotaria sp. Silwood2]CAF3985672.1 unnamed protein product [Rotaria sp. Silwood2]
MFSRKFSEYHETIARCADKRIQTLSEMINGCYAVKMNNWEEPVEKQVDSMRQQEFDAIRKASRMRAMNMELFFALMPLITLATLVGVWLTHDQSVITGQILIDDVDISRISLKHLRSHLSVIPQQAALFSGSLRSNLDPFNHYSDEQCWKALEAVQFKTFVASHSDGLFLPIAESGINLSAGQRQLICATRAILKQSKILLIDEATANVDPETDHVIQQLIIHQFQDRTVLTIAHRINTVIQSDRILVLNKGQVESFDVPQNILHQYQ